MVASVVGVILVSVGLVGQLLFCAVYLTDSKGVAFGLAAPLIGGELFNNRKRLANRSRDIHKA